MSAFTPGQRVKISEASSVFVAGLYGVFRGLRDDGGCPEGLVELDNGWLATVPLRDLEPLHWAEEFFWALATCLLGISAPPLVFCLELFANFNHAASAALFVGLILGAILIFAHSLSIRPK